MSVSTGSYSPSRISDVYGLMVLDSRGTPTIKAYVETVSGVRGWGIAPSGASKGEHEAVEVRDGGKKWLGKGVERALSNLEDIAAHMIGLDARDQAYIDHLLISLDGTPNKSRLGGNTTTALSIAVARAASYSLGLEPYEYLGGNRANLIPTPLMNIINGGVHAGNDLDIQEFMIIPVEADSIKEALRKAVEVYWTLKKLLVEKYGKNSINVGDEGGFAPPLTSTREALDLLVEAISRAGYDPGTDFYLGLDAAASQFKDSDKYRIDGKVLDADQLVEFYLGLLDEYPVKYLEDPFAEDDWHHFVELTKRVSTKTLVTGDDLYVTNTKFLEKGIKLAATNAVLVKINQVGTLTETLEFVDMATRNCLRAIISHRSGDTEDPFIADLAVALGTGLIKTGAPARGERTAKYNRLLEIEFILAGQARYAGRTPFPR
ncbi:MAG: phosphopyruvate hydratase [Desulfurococcales archaeon]|nr:phosphopyruvate hydratase [Desulfurococcales archaeon]